VLSLPYLACLDSHNLQSNKFTSTFLALSVTICSPIMVLNLLLRHPVPIPHDIFDAPTTPRSILRHAHSIGSTSTFADGNRLGSRMKLISGSAVNGKGYSTRFPRVLAPAPRLSIFPVGDTSFVPFPQSRNWHDAPGLTPAHLPSPLAPIRITALRHSSSCPHDIKDAAGQHIYDYSRAMSLPSHRR